VLRIEGYRRYANKVWNAVMFVRRSIGGVRSSDFNFISEIEKDGQTHNRERWVVERLVEAVRSKASFKTYALPTAVGAIYKFWWSDICDVYIEATKPALQSNDEQAQCVKAFLVLCCDFL
jgi:valyl-tRNA synthetase